MLLAKDCTTVFEGRNIVCVDKGAILVVSEFMIGVSDINAIDCGSSVIRVSIGEFLKQLSGVEIAGTGVQPTVVTLSTSCLLYTSDAADE